MLDAAPAHRVRPLVHRVVEVGAMATVTADPVARRIRDAVAGFCRDTVTKELNS